MKFVINALLLASTTFASCELNFADFSKQLEHSQYKTYFRANSWGSHNRQYPQEVCEDASWKRKRILAAIEDIAVPLKLNYCHHHSPFWQGKNIEHICSTKSFRPQNYTDINALTNAYRWNSTYAQSNIENYQNIISQEVFTQTDMQNLINALYPKKEHKLIDDSWIGDKNLAFVGVDCSNLTSWIYKIALNIDFSSAIQTQAGQEKHSKMSAKEIFKTTDKQKNAAGEFVVFNNEPIDAKTIEENPEILDTLQVGDLLFIHNADKKVSHVIIWTGKKIGAPKSGITDKSVAIEFIAPTNPIAKSTRAIGDYIIVDSHFQGTDYRSFSGWYKKSLWAIRRIIK
ncbi:MAG: hypothetical protein RL154_936 [Pseudomonadota bacterium]|jgi:cell wall-associated NlpC family hydrolase